MKAILLKILTVLIFSLSVVLCESIQFKNAVFIPNHADHGRRSLMHVDLQHE